MQREFYKDMARRTSLIALFGELFMLLRARTQTLAGYGFKKIEDQIMLVFMMMRVIMEKTLAEETCTLDDLTGALTELNAELFHLPLDYEALRRLASLLVVDVLSNSGEPIVFHAFESEDYIAHPLYITSTVTYEGNAKKASYRMSDDGFRLMLSTLEMEENMQLQFRDLVLEMQLKRRNYSQALDEIRHIFEILKIRELDFQEKTALVRQDAALLSAAAYKEMIEENYTILSDARERFAKYQKQVREQTEDLSEKLTNSALEGPDFENLQTLEQIDKMLSRSVVAITRILKALADFSQAFSGELSAQFRAGSARRYSFSRLVMDRVYENPDLLDAIHTYLHPLFGKNPEPVFQLSPAFEYRQLLNKDEKDGFVEVEEDYDEAAEQKRKQQERESRARLNQAVYLLFDALLQKEDGQLNLAEFGQPQGFPDNLDEARLLLASLADTRTISLAGLAADYEELVVDEDVPWSFPLALLENFGRLPGLGNYAWLDVEKGEGSVNYTLEEEGLKISLNMDNIRFVLKGGQDERK